MVRPFGVNGKKRKKREQKFDDVKDGEEVEVGVLKRALVEKADSGKEAEAEVEVEGVGVAAHELDGIPIASSDLKSNNEAGIVFVLEKASLEVAKVGKSYQLLNSDDHSNFLRKNNKNPADYRPDIVHHALLSILDSPLNKAGRLRAVYVRTDKGVLIEVKPHVRIPRTFKRFAGIMLQLLQKLSITAVGKREKLFRVIKNPVTQYFPVNSHKIGFSYSSKSLVRMQDYLNADINGTDYVFVVGAMAHGKIECEYVDDYIAISGYPLSAAFCIARICTALEEKMNIL